MITITTVLFLIITSFSISSAQQSIKWAGYEWLLKDGAGMGPGPNNWKSNNVWVDKDNKLHLKLRRAAGKGGWTCAEAYTRNKFSFGTFQFFVEGPIDKLDPNVVFGLFTYGGADGTNEIDIEAAKWGKTEAAAPNFVYTVYPHTLRVANPAQSATRISLQGNYTTHRFTWTAASVAFQSQNGFYSSNQNIFYSYQTPASFKSSMTSISAPLHINLWTFQGKPPSNDQEVEIIIHEFKYTKA